MKYNVEHRELYIKVMKELKRVFTCNTCRRTSMYVCRYRSEYNLNHRFIYCSRLCEIMAGIGGGTAYSN